MHSVCVKALCFVYVKGLLGPGFVYVKALLGLLGLLGSGFGYARCFFIYTQKGAYFAL